jgi:cyclohexyl-isocyanide hydratase
MKIGFLLYPDVTQLDLTGPAQVLSRLPGAEVRYVAATPDPVMSDCALALVPTATFADCPPLDLVCVPGGYGCVPAMEDAPTIAWLRAQAAGAAWVTSVCTGSLVLGAAGLIDGYRAACHWAWGDQLALFGATWERARVVVDRNRISGGGVTAGIDFAFRVAAEVAGRDVAERIQLTLEYDPQPMAGGTPESARPEVLAAAREAMAGRLPARRAAIAAVARRYAATRAAA